MDVIEGQRRPHGPLGFRLHGLRPKAGKAVAVRDKVDAVSIRRPARFVVPVRVADDPDPVALFRRSITLKGCDQHLQASRRSLPVHSVKSNPAAIVSEGGVKQRELGRLKIIASLAGGKVDHAYRGLVLLEARPVKEKLYCLETSRKAAHASVAELLKQPSFCRNDINVIYVIVAQSQSRDIA